MIFWLIISTVVFFTSWRLTLATQSHAIKNDLLDHPDNRSSHKIPTPSGGGIAIVATYLSSLAGLWFVGSLDSQLFIALFAGGGLIAAVGYWDDRSPLPAKVRLIAHFLSAAIAIIALQVWSLEYPWNTWLPVWVNVPLLSLGIVWMVNLYNFMDGIDGIAGIESISTALVLLIFSLYLGQSELAILMLLLAASSAGFLRCNWPPASIFLGDVGSGFLGFEFAVFAVASEAKFELPIWVWLILLAVFFIDTGVTLVRRMLSGEVWYRAHRSHAYQILSRRWGSHKRVVFSVLVLNLLWLTPLSALALYLPDYWFVLLGVAVLPLLIIAILLKAGDQSV